MSSVRKICKLFWKEISTERTIIYHLFIWLFIKRNDMKIRYIFFRSELIYIPFFYFSYSFFWKTFLLFCIVWFGRRKRIILFEQLFETKMNAIVVIWFAPPLINVQLAKYNRKCECFGHRYSVALNQSYAQVRKCL